MKTPFSARACWWQPASAKDGDLCTTAETCKNGTCAGKPRVCDDGEVCTKDSCVADEGCVNVATDAKCNDGDACTDQDACVDAGTCANGYCAMGGPAGFDLRFGFSGVDLINDATVAGSGWALVGHRVGEGGLDGWFMRVDLAGAVLAEKILAGSGSDSLRGIANGPNDTFILVGGRVVVSASAGASALGHPMWQVQRTTAGVGVCK